MKSKDSNSTIRAFGQRSIPSTLFFRPHPPIQTRSRDGDEGAESRPPPKRVSFSDYLNRKLSSKSVLPRTPQLDQSNKDKQTKENNECGTRGQNKGTGGAIEESVFKQFNLVNANQVNEENFDRSDENVVEVLSDCEAVQGFRKRKNAPEDVGDQRCAARSRLMIIGEDASHRKETCSNKRPKLPYSQGNTGANQMQCTIKKHLVVLGDDPKPKRHTHRQRSLSNMQQKPHYNYYENGAGWWDYDREGVDNDEVGCKEVWEGMGSTTLGEIADWH